MGLLLRMLLTVLCYCHSLSVEMERTKNIYSAVGLLPYNTYRDIDLSIELTLF